ncbi:hypothetical protein G6F70_008784 [Rhizopus microsporus]|uniref:Uncharacterized protein n=2 Tax=Rhizopus TaxID=4842 RepID=A0A367J9I3_RHIAZ|nr:hypothetical protein G6F71_008363 [Rhizopus microsporus]RCH86587.1 hypothetical protein CU097_004905 [Rhizopus azygosporus]KAG1194723.1 hypothetical protein G6F70_008784 [Rhizopus microsporus]KAG1207063.1 hypothetical protein G6F69_008347 [Rhizopus microsporus]KAG1228366.1 hypothetical protein G6F67_007864 [Rhizopus microsporus]
MKLSLSIFLLAAAALQVQAAANPVHAAAAKCISGSAGKGNGDGYKGFCCKTSDDCFESCVSGVCNGPTKPTKTTTSSAPAPSCIAGSKGLGNGDGYKGYCCENSDDCINSCVSGICNGPTKPTQSSGTKTATSPAPTGTCTAGSKGKGNGDGYKGYCCKNSDDCIDTCVKGVCNGPTKPGSPTTTTTTATSTSTSGPKPTCAAGSYGLGNGDGYKGDCCKNSDDCVNSCVNGVCNGPSNPTPTPGKCIPGYEGLDNGKGPFNACCASNDDCIEACVRGRCTKP